MFQRALGIAASSTGISIGSDIGGTAGSVLFVDASGGLGEDNANFFWDISNTRLGILNNAPEADLHIGAETSLISNVSNAIAPASSSGIFVADAGPAAGTETQGGYVLVTTSRNGSDSGIYAGVIVDTVARIGQFDTGTADLHLISSGHESHWVVHTSATPAVAGTGVYLQGQNANDRLHAPQGLEATPGYSFHNFTGHGMYLLTTGNDILGFSLNGEGVLELRNETSTLTAELSTFTTTPNQQVINASVTNWRVHYFGVQDVNGTISPRTITSAATVYIEGGITVSGTAAVTNNYALWVDSGLSRFDGDGTDVFEVPDDATDPTGGGVYGRIPVHVTGVGTKYIAIYS